MKRIIPLILALLLSFSLFSVSAVADDSVPIITSTLADDLASSLADDSASTLSDDSAATVADDSANDIKVKYYIYDIPLFCERITDAFERCRLNNETLKSLRKANWEKTDDMLRSEIVGCFHEHDKLKSEIEGLIPAEIEDCFHNKDGTVQSAAEKQALSEFIRNNLDLYNEKVEDMLKLHGEIVDHYLERYNRGLNTKEEIAYSIEKIANNEGAIAAAEALGIYLEIKETSKQSAPPTSVMVWIPETGDHYHDIPNCGKMNPNKATQVTLEWAKSNGYAWCEDCQPPR